MSEETIGKWMGDEHARLLELHRCLRQRIAARPARPSSNWLHGLRAVFEDYAEDLRKHMAHEERGGYLKAVVEARPFLVHQVEALQSEHDQFGVLLNQLHASLLALRPEHAVLIRDVIGRFENLLAGVERHEEHENHLVLSALTEDIGDGD